MSKEVRYRWEGVLTSMVGRELAASTLQRQLLERPRPFAADFYPTVVDLLALPQLAHVRLLTARTTADSRRVMGTSVQELPIADFVRPGELVMSTGIAVADSEARLMDFVHALAMANVSALAVAVGRHVSHISSDAIREADRLGLSLLQFPWELPFSEVTELVLGHVVNRQLEWLRRSEEIHEELTRIVLSGADLQQLCQFVEQRLDRPVRIVDRWGEATDGGPGSLAESQPDWQKRGATIVIDANGRRLGKMLVGTEAGRLSDLDNLVANHSATAAALVMLMHRAVAEDKARGQSEFLMAVLNGSSGLTVELERRAETLGFDPRANYSVIHVSPFQRGSGECDLVDAARWTVQRALSSRHMTALQAWNGSDVTLVLPSGLMRVERSRIDALVDDVTSYLRRQSPGICVSVGIGTVATSLADVRKSLREAITACTLGVALRGVGHRTEYSELGPYPALYEALNAPGSAIAIEALQERYLGAAARYESQTGLPLTDTIVALINNRGNVSATARDLRINRQSLLYRLERFQAISSVDLSSTVDRFALELALRSWLIKRGQSDLGFASDHDARIEPHVAAS